MIALLPVMMKSPAAHAVCVTVSTCMNDLSYMLAEGSCTALHQTVHISVTQAAAATLSYLFHQHSFAVEHSAPLGGCSLWGGYGAEVAVAV